MIFNVHCASCGEWVLNADSKTIGFPFTPEMFVIPIETAYGRMWSLPGRIDFDLQCPECLDFPLGHRDGCMSPYLRVKLDEDRRFSRLMSLDEIQTRVAVLEDKADFAARVEKVKLTHDRTGTTLTPERKAEISKKLEEIRSNSSAARRMASNRVRALEKKRKKKLAREK